MTREQYLNQRSQLMAQAKGFLDAGNIEQFNATKKQIEELDAKFEAEAQAQANYAALQGAAVTPPVLQNLGGAMEGTPAATPSADPYDTAEYNMAFMNYACRHQPLPAKFLNAAATTTAADVPAVIPTTMLKEIIRELKERGLIFQQLRHLNIEGGVAIPVLDLAPVANWVGEAASEDQKVESKTTIQFSYYGLECKIAQTLLASVVTIEEFQNLFVDLAVEAIFAAVEKGVFKGTGVNQMLGVCNDPRVKNIVELSPTEVGSYKAWKNKVFSAIKKRYQRGKFHMAQGTFESHIDGMVDAGGQPIGRVNYGIDGVTKYRFAGKDVETTEDDVLPTYEAATAGDVFAVYMNMKDYVFNSNMKMTVVHWTDHDNGKKKTKVMLICDGKIADANGVILIKKAAAAQA